jgi:hypothetical protein
VKDKLFYVSQLDIIARTTNHIRKHSDYHPSPEIFIGSGVTQNACFLAGLINGSGILIVSLSLELNGNHDDSHPLWSSTFPLYVLYQFLNWFVMP